MTQFTNIISEHYLLGSILWEPEDNILRLRGDGITSQHFTTSLNKRIWNQVCSFYDSDRLHSIEVLEIEPEILGLPDGRELAVHISDLRRSFSGSAHLPQHIKIVRQFMAVRDTYKAAQSAIAMIECGESAEAVIDALEASMATSRESLISSKPWKDSDEIAEEMIEIIKAGQKDDGMVGQSSGIPLIDTHTGGLEDGQFWVIAAPSSCGKTLLMLQIAQAFQNDGKQVLVFSFETQAGKIGIRGLSNSQSIDGKELLGKGGQRMTKQTIQRAKTGLMKFKERGNLTVCDNFDLTLESMTAITAMRLKIGHKIDLIVVDYIQLVSLSDCKGKGREQQVAEVSRGLKKLAKMAGCPVLSASQLNEEGKTRESRSIIQDADVLLNIDPENDCVHLAKNRDAERGEMLKLRMNGSYQRFEQHYDEFNK